MLEGRDLPSSSANLSIAASGPSAVTAGTSVTYSLTLTNTGPADAQGVVLNDTLPSGATRASITPGGGNPDSFTFSLANGVFTSKSGTVPAGNTDTFQVVVFAPSNLAVNFAFNDSASVTTTTSNTGSPTSASVNNNITAFWQLNISAMGPSAVTAGTSVTYTLTLTNVGPSDAQGVTLSDTLPTGAVNPVLTALSNPDGFTFALANGVFTSNALTVPAGNTDTFRLVLSAPSNLASGAAFNDSLSVNDVNAGPPTTIAINNRITTVASLTVAASGPASVDVGTPVTYTFALTNSGPSDAQAVTLTEALSASGGTPSISAAPGNPDAFAFTLAGTTFTSAPITVARGHTDLFTVVARPGTAGTFTAVTSVSGATANPNAANSRVTVSTAVASPGSPNPPPSPGGQKTPTPVGTLTLFAFGFGPGFQLDSFLVDQKGQVFAEPFSFFSFFGGTGSPVFISANVVLSDVQFSDAGFLAFLQMPGGQPLFVDLLDFFDPFVLNAVFAALLNPAA
jgi:uncharacterized repeat protein (TIGR01451 family)